MSTTKQSRATEVGLKIKLENGLLDLSFRVSSKWLLGIIALICTVLMPQFKDFIQIFVSLIK